MPGGSSQTLATSRGVDFNSTSSDAGWGILGSWNPHVIQVGESWSNGRWRTWSGRSFGVSLEASDWTQKAEWSVRLALILSPRVKKHLCRTSYYQNCSWLLSTEYVTFLGPECSNILPRFKVQWISDYPIEVKPLTIPFVTFQSVALLLFWKPQPSTEFPSHLRISDRDDQGLLKRYLKQEQVELEARSLLFKGFLRWTGTTMLLLRLNPAYKSSGLNSPRSWYG